MKKKTKLIIGIVALILILAAGYILYIYNEKQEQKERQEKEKAIQEKIEDIETHYNQFVKTTELINLYDNEENIIGKINSEFELEDIEITETTKYFKIKDSKYFVKFEEVEPIESLKDVDNWYKHYVVFNENVVTKETTKLYNDENLEYEFNQEMSFPIIIKETDRYYVEYNNKLLYVLKNEIKETIPSSNTTEKVRTTIRPLAYHAIYDPNTENCATIICHTESQFSSHMKYLQDEGYFTLKMKDVELFLDGKIRIPVKSTVITIDDGFMGTRAIPILERYNINATMFLITSWYDPKSFQSENLELHSHSHDMHNVGVCPGGQGGGIKCLAEATIQEDLKKSREILNGSTVFCYPFYEYNEYSTNQLKKAGVTLAFIGAAGVSGVATQNVTDKLKVPRMTIFSTTTMAEFKNYVK